MFSAPFSTSFMYLTSLFLLSPAIWVRTRFLTLLQMLSVAFAHSPHCEYDKSTQTHTHMHEPGNNWLSGPWTNDSVASVDVDSCSATPCSVCTCCVFGFAHVSVILRECEHDKNMKDSLIWINLEHENETDRWTRRSRQGELCWVLKMIQPSRTVTGRHDSCCRGQARCRVANCEFAQVY